MLFCFVKSRQKTPPMSKALGWGDSPVNEELTSQAQGPEFSPQPGSVADDYDPSAGLVETEGSLKGDGKVE